MASLNYVALFLILSLATVALHVLRIYALGKYAQVQDRRPLSLRRHVGSIWAPVTNLGRFGRWITGALALASLLVAVLREALH